MADESKKPEHSDRLESWKEIAAYLGRDVRTVQRWERTEGLPVQRHQHGERGSVYAYRSDIEAWREARQAPGPDPSPAASRQWRPAAVAAAAIAIAGLAMWAASPFLNGSRRPPDGSAALANAQTDAPRLLEALTRDGADVRIASVPKGHHYLTLANGDRELYVAHDQGGVSVIDTATMKVTRGFEARQPLHVVRSDDDRTVYVGTNGGTVLAIDVRTHTVAEIVVGARVRGIAVSPNNATLYIAGLYSGLLAVDTSTRTVRRLSGLPCPTALARSPDGARLYVNYQCNGPGGRPGHDAIDVVDTATGTSLGAILGLANVGGQIAVSPDGSQIWADGSDACDTARYDHVGCPTEGRGVVNVLRASDRTLIRALDIASGRGESGSWLTFTPDGSRVVAVYPKGMQVFNTATLATTEELATLTYGSAVFSRDGQWMYVPARDGTAIAAVPIVKRSPPPAGLSGRWTADGTTNDSHAIAHGETEGAIGYAAGYIGRAFALGEPAGSIRINISNLGISTHPFTLSLWLNLPARDDSAPMTIADSTSPDMLRGWRLLLTPDSRLSACFADGRSACAGNGSRSVASTTSLRDGSWTHVALSWDGGTVRLYVNGRLDGEGALPAFADVDSGWLRLGFTKGGHLPFSGRLDEIEIYERTLTPAEIAGRASIRP